MHGTMELVPIEVSLLLMLCKGICSFKKEMRISLGLYDFFDLECIACVSVMIILLLWK